MLWLMISSVFAYDPSVAQGHTGILNPLPEHRLRFQPLMLKTHSYKLVKSFFVLPQTTQVKVAEWLYNT